MLNGGSQAIRAAAEGDWTRALNIAFLSAFFVLLGLMVWLVRNRLSDISKSIEQLADAQARRDMDLGRTTAEALGRVSDGITTVSERAAGISRDVETHAHDSTRSHTRIMEKLIKIESRGGTP